MTLVVLGSLLLAAVFLTAGVAKLRDLQGSREAMEGFGVPARLASPLGLAVPIAELAVALALSVGSSRTWGALGALALLAAFSVAIAWNLAHGRAPDCHCFGQLHSSPAGPKTLARNAALLGLAGLVASQADPAWSGTAALAGLALAGVGSALSRRPRPVGTGSSFEGLEIGSPAPSFKLPRLDGYLVDLGSLLNPGRPALLVFSDPDCGPCRALAPDVADWQRRYPGDLTVAVIESRQDRGEQPESDQHDRRNVLLQRESEVSDSYRAQGTPTAVLIAADGTIASGIAAGSVAIEALVAASVDHFEPRRPPAQVERWTRPRLLGGPLLRRDFLARGATAGAAISMAMAWPRQAIGTRRAGRKGCGSYQERCGRRCCPRGTICNNPEGDGLCIDICPNDDRPDSCGPDCTNFDTDSRNCGGCRDQGRRCPRGTTCAGGKCVSGDDSVCPEDPCPDGFICCAGFCVSPENSLDCGGCGRPCEHPSTCCFGRCVADLQSDPLNCGACLEHCGRKQVCHNGRCRDECPPGLRQCGRTCGQPSTQACCKGKLIDRGDLQFDEKNCGKCGNKCGGIFGPATCCSGKCVELGLDNCNCGVCGKVCAPGEYCRGDDGCICPLGQTCPGDNPPQDCGSASRSSSRLFGRRRRV